MIHAACEACKLLVDYHSYKGMKIEELVCPICYRPLTSFTPESHSWKDGYHFDKKHPYAVAKNSLEQIFRAQAAQQAPLDKKKGGAKEETPPPRPDAPEAIRGSEGLELTDGLKERVAENQEQLRSDFVKCGPHELPREIWERSGLKHMHEGTCPLGGTNPAACMLCGCGHMLHCHYPNSCEEASCSHYLEETEPCPEYPEEEAP